MSWGERKGACNHCGYCCEYLGPAAVVLERKPDQDLDPAFYALRRAAVVTDDRVAFVYHAALPCSAHTPDVPDGCAIYATRPQTCRAFPSDPSQIEGTPCSFYFERGRERRGGQGSPYPTPSRLLPASA